ncbi:hypothetical protein Tco_1030403 [Tanacetum coccineum]|uniref:Uncharacterized protein n=1 Tax=Tanacetum coccineum TaxID=301880 RepID=A0ABQ5G647_9ASTR
MLEDFSSNGKGPLSAVLFLGIQLTKFFTRNLSLQGSDFPEFQGIGMIIKNVLVQARILWIPESMLMFPDFSLSTDEVHLALLRSMRITTLPTLMFFGSNKYPREAEQYTFQICGKAVVLSDAFCPSGRGMRDIFNKTILVVVVREYDSSFDIRVLFSVGSGSLDFNAFFFEISIECLVQELRALSVTDSILEALKIALNHREKS